MVMRMTTSCVQCVAYVLLDMVVVRRLDWETVSTVSDYIVNSTLVAN